MKLELVGGPYDGLERTRTTVGFVFVSGDPGELAGVRLWDAPGKGRVLYREFGNTRAGALAMVYAPHDTLCGGCGVLHAAAEQCSLCGAKLVA